VLRAIGRLLPVSDRRVLHRHLPGRRQELPAVLILVAAVGCARAPERPRGGPFRCAAAVCEQGQPRLPDDGEWECVELDGAVVCRGGVPAAGVVAGPPDPGWRCGVRRGSSERLCVDDAPELPGPGWRCRFTHEHGERRLCREDASAPPPPPPPRDPPSCWIDRDCGSGTCRRGSCA
jgi:hypothetical protein